ncbi:hypothetical protein NEOLEDRAFT_205602 [Neolentinus lepideus HHB14362 ss-1]|uniref:Uncharacterized protein n=1 Tax=Neolentinus lepideus HHB14362 ss-1 TaxID=1314782 RepID=A0A165TJ54_9AGAM|nr:hypothetical protein NEOLEDRAFT_205602 [Neolentinus lepideus HHB14362 ss-1]
MVSAASTATHIYSRRFRPRISRHCVRVVLKPLSPSVNDARFGYFKAWNRSVAATLLWISITAAKSSHLLGKSSLAASELLVAVSPARLLPRKLSRAARIAETMTW